jgi:hypothetical protein
VKEYDTKKYEKRCDKHSHDSSIADSTTDWADDERGYGRRGWLRLRCSC